MLSRNITKASSKLASVALRTTTRGMAGPPPRDGMTPAELKEGAKLARSHKHFKQRSTAPTSLTDVMPATPQYMPEDKSEIAVFNGFPAD